MADSLEKPKSGYRELSLAWRGRMVSRLKKVGRTKASQRKGVFMRSRQLPLELLVKGSAMSLLSDSAISLVIGGRTPGGPGGRQ